MKSYFKQYRPFFIFLFRFFLVYILATVAYQSYLGTVEENIPDAITTEVAQETVWLLERFGCVAEIALHPSEPSHMLRLNSVYVARIVEGCNAVSVAILFASFIVAFKGRTKHTIFFILTGFFIIHTLNVVRITLLGMALLHYPEYEHFLHGIVFPLVIYGVVFLLWVVWVNRFSLYVGKNK